VVAGRAVGLVRGGAGAARRITGAGDVALIERGADDGVRPHARAGLAGVALRTGVPVRAGAAVRLGGVGAGAARRIAGTGDVALVEGGADDGVRRNASAGLAGVGLGAGVPVAAGGTIRLGGVGADAACRIAGTGVVALIE